MVVAGLTTLYPAEIFMTSVSPEFIYAAYLPRRVLAATPHAAVAYFFATP